MPRLQILELPEGSGDDRPPFVLVVDEWDIDSLEANDMLTNYWDAFGKKIGARGVLFVDRTIAIPANDTSAYLADPHYEMSIGGQSVNWTEHDEAQAKVTEALRLGHERTDIARDMDRLATHKAALLDALGMDRTRDWDDIRNAAAGLRKQRDDQAATAERVRQIHYKHLQDDRHEDTGVCNNDGEDWPCRTIQALTSAGDAERPEV